MPILFAVFYDLLLAHVYMSTKAGEDLALGAIVGILVNGLAVVWACVNF